MIQIHFPHNLHKYRPYTTMYLKTTLVFSSKLQTYMYVDFLRIMRCMTYRSDDVRSIEGNMLHSCRSIVVYIFLKCDKSYKPIQKMCYSKSVNGMETGILQTGCPHNKLGGLWGPCVLATRILLPISYGTQINSIHVETKTHFNLSH